MIRSLFFLWLCLWLALPSHGRAEATPAPRTILALYSLKEERALRVSNLHRMAEMPLNHLGYKLRYHNVDQGIEKIAFTEDVHGILAWFPPGTRLKDPHAYIDFLHRVADAELPLVIMGDLGFIQKPDGAKLPLETINDVLHRFGVQIEDYWVGVTYDAELTHIDRTLFPFERPFPTLLPQYQSMTTFNDEAEVILAAHHKRGLHTDATLALISPQFSYISQGYSFYERNEQDTNKIFYQWYVNPFRFFARAFGSDHTPKPDVTTHAGRRIFYSHIDGDGWNNISEAPEYRNEFALASRVILEEVLKKHPQIPTSVAPIAAELDPTWVGRKNSQQVAKDIFALAHVEATSHTYSHPFAWRFFDGYSPEKEAPYLEHYKNGHWEQSFFDQLLSRGGLDTANLRCSMPEPEEDHDHAYDDNSHDQEDQPIPARYQIPRAYGNAQFNLDLEICGAAEKISEYTPNRQPVRLVQWSGDTAPYKDVLAKLEQHDMLNINGGDTRFDPEYPSYIWVSPIGRQVGDYWQIYASNSNENTYTKDWSVRYYGFQYLPRTWENTNLPYRIKPANLYYHTFTGERLSSLNALKKNIKHANTLDLHPMWASRYASIAKGFYSTKLVNLNSDSWKIEDRGDLQTIRFDHASFKTVDYARSTGVIGHQYHGGSLYVFCDKSVKSPVITLHNSKNSINNESADRAFLYQSSWDVWSLERRIGGFRFSARGFGKGEMHWHLPTEFRARVLVTDEHGNEVKDIDYHQQGSELHLALPMRTNEKMTITVKYQELSTKE